MNNKKTPGAIVRITQVISKHFKVMLILIFFIIVLFPTVVWLMYSVLPTIFYTEITADGMLSYFGSAVGGLIAIFAAFIAIYQSRIEMEASQEESEQQRLADICPRLQVTLRKSTINPLVFNFTMVNCGEKSALDIYLYADSFLQFLFPHDTCKKAITFNKSCKAHYIYADGSTFDDDGYPKNILVNCRDIDNNIIRQDFMLFVENGEHIYQMLGKPEYEEVV